VSLRKYVTEKAIDFRTLAPEPRHAEIEKFGTALMNAVGRVVPVLPVSLVATVMLEAEDQRSLLEIKERVSNLIGELEGQGTYVHIPRADRDYAIAVGLRMLTLRHLVLEVDGNYRANPKELILLRYYANSIAHLFPVISGREQSERARNP
jgi:glycerol-3-phosphate O-acyltransferase